MADREEEMEGERLPWPPPRADRRYWQRVDRVLDKIVGIASSAGTSGESDPDPVPFVRFRYRNNSRRRARAQVVLISAETDPPTEFPVVVPTSGGTVDPGTSADVVFGEPPLNVVRIWGSVVLEPWLPLVHPDVGGHAFDSGYRPDYAAEAEIVTYDDHTDVLWIS